MGGNPTEQHDPADRFIDDLAFAVVRERLSQVFEAHNLAHRIDVVRARRVRRNRTGDPTTATATRPWSQAKIGEAGMICRPWTTAVPVELPL
jgi:hypothetical protein